MEKWALNHPELGLIELEVGYDSEFLALDPAWPEQPEDDEEITPVTAESGLKERFSALFTNPPVRARILLNGKVLHRLCTISSARYLLKDSVEEDKLTAENAGLDRAKPHLKVTSNLFNDVLEVEFRQGSDIVLFDPPAGSRGEKRREAMESSTLKRVGFPILAGLGKGGWAIAVIILAPLVSRFVQWLLSFLPDFDINLPSLPDFPQIELPNPNLPQIQLPTPNINIDINLPELPAWVELLLDYSKIWVPILIGIVVGLLALRNYKKSEETKRAWQEKQRAKVPVNTSTAAEQERSVDADEQAGRARESKPDSNSPHS
ncbi:MAG: hypothetical protein L0K51_00470 [Corynebacterium casei]|uniref:hypothetical protein n=1 Tax=Corynebacterium casei TaxID=160386 RepID=UPI00264A0292|nr:hypothetical protein [Corynebacterium casei]MDN5798425.1 hypothetical protein [Corynebacterium casei]MDN5920899.1 hypothetical protein [Corynebacterium casei]MDN6284215.1 hypothetical protein [Corynebacterium casei]MDN6311682.1 hypothetical protein [Corynebacterium casei]MDN6339828.1 hypothetical protein [Corynebacterium casei]